MGRETLGHELWRLLLSSQNCLTTFPVLSFLLQRLSSPLPQPWVRCRIQWLGWVPDNSQRPPGPVGHQESSASPWGRASSLVLLTPPMFSDSHTAL